MPLTSTYPASNQQQQKSQDNQGLPPGKMTLPQMQQQQQAKGLQQTGLAAQVGSIAQNNQGLSGINAQTPATGAPRANVVRPGQTNLNDIAENLGRNYGISLGATPLVDEAGNFNRMPTTGQEAVGFQFISQAIADEQNRREQQKAQGAIQEGLGQVQKRGRGSLATLQSTGYESMAQMYASNQHKAADFSYFVQKEQLDKAEELVRRNEAAAKKSGRHAMIGGIIGGVIGAYFGGPMGAAAGYQVGSAVGGGSYF